MNTDTIKTVDYPRDTHLSLAVKEFLRPLNSGGPGLETLPADEARNALFNLQESIPVDYSGITESEKTVTHLGCTVTLNIVKPERTDGVTPVFMFTHGGGWILGGLLNTQTYGARPCNPYRLYRGFCEL